MPNELKTGDVRIGWIIDGDSESLRRVVGLRNTGEEIHVEIPYDFDDAHSYWFTGGATYADDPDRTKRRYEPPEVLLFVDNDGPVVLVGCTFRQSSMGSYGGHGVVRANAAIIGGHSLAYDKVNAFRSVLPALGQWSGITSKNQAMQRDDEGKVTSLSIELSEGSPLTLARSKNLTLRPTWRTSHGDLPGHVVTVDEVQLETSLSRPAGLDEHFALHQTIRQLLIVAAGENFGFSDVRVSRQDDPQRTLDGTAHGTRWAPLMSPVTPAHTPSAKPPQFIFELDDIGPAGVRRWLKLQEEYQRGLRPLIDVLDGTATTLEGRLFSLGVAIEALGYQSERASGGTNLDGRGRLSFPKSIDRIQDDIGWPAIREPAAWRSQMIAAYSGVKHADNPLPDVRTMFETSRLATVVLRSWVASKLGATRERTRWGFRVSGAAELVPDES